jgi:hypothetical protein
MEIARPARRRERSAVSHGLTERRLYGCAGTFSTKPLL